MKKEEQRVIDKVDETLEDSIGELCDFLAVPSVSAVKERRKDIEKAADWLCGKLNRLGLNPRILPTGGPPVVMGDYCPFKDRPTLLIYGHYDVQPEEPLEAWYTNPFVPTIKNGYIYARGASDDKGQLFTYLKAMEIIQALGIVLPVNVKVLFEGEEEIGSPHLKSFLENHLDDVRADIIVISDGSKYSDEIPAITYGLRGLSYLELLVKGPARDLHSGSYGGIVKNPINALAFILSSLIDSRGRIRIDHFYDDVLPLEDWEREAMKRWAADDEHLKRSLGVESLLGEEGYSVTERKTARPTLDINGIWGGYQGEGSKTVIPSEAGAKVSMRLVPNQKHKNIDRLFKDFVERICPEGVKVEVKALSGTDPVLVPRNISSVKAAKRALTKVFGVEPVFIREGGSIPVVSMFKDTLNVDSILLLGWGSPGDGPHGPNEKFSIKDLERGIKSAALLFFELAGE